MSLRRHRHIVLQASIAALFLWAAGLAGARKVEAQVLPANPDKTCVVTPSEFKSWFKVAPGPDQPVVEANSIALNTSNNCNFYKWSAQMFLWLTSPATGQYQGNRVLDSQVFYQISNDTLVPQGSRRPIDLALRAAKSGPDGLPVVIDSAGHLREFVTAPSKAGITARDVLGIEGLGEIASIKRGDGGKALALDAQGKSAPLTPKVTEAMLPPILDRLTSLVARPQGATTEPNAAPSRQQIAQALTAKHVLIKVATATGATFVEAGTGIVDNLGPGQAGGNGVLISQANAPIFYEVIVNDVYAWYLTGRKTQGGIGPFLCDPSSPKCTNPAYGLFPTTSTDLTTITNFAKANGGPQSFVDGDALAVEAKLSWVEASTLPNRAQGYIISIANLPVYNRTNSTDWSPAGTRLTPVALVGAHVVGSTAGHPEMVWATFEHQANTPLAQYQYKSNGATVTVPTKTTGAWLFSADGATPSPTTTNAELARFDAGDGHIVSNASPPAAIAPSNILREKSWGAAYNGVPNQEDATPAAANTQVISLDTDVRAKLSAVGAGVDPRFNYLLIGATWTLGGNEPTCPFPFATNASPCPYAINDEIGTSMLANSTMETFMQGGDSTFATGTNCFSCHQSSGNNPQTKANTNVSHFFPYLSALPHS